MKPGRKSKLRGTKQSERFFPQILQFFVPKLYFDVDFTKKISFLDKKMEQLSKRSMKGAKYVDKLAKVYLKDGNEQWILVHIEVQGYPEKEFSLRMFRYFYRIFDKHGRRVVSMAIMTGSEKGTDEGIYELEAYRIEFQYPVFRVMDYDRDDLENNPNPMAIVVLASQEKERACMIPLIE